MRRRHGRSCWPAKAVVSGSSRQARTVAVRRAVLRRSWIFWREAIPQCRSLLLQFPQLIQPGLLFGEPRAHRGKNTRRRERGAAGRRSRQRHWRRARLASTVRSKCQPGTGLGGAGRQAELIVLEAWQKDAAGPTTWKSSSQEVHASTQAGIMEAREEGWTYCWPSATRTLVSNCAP